VEGVRGTRRYDNDAIEPIKEVYFDKMKPAVSDDELVLLRQRYQLKRKE
jgi:hypothetical protein